MAPCIKRVNKKQTIQRLAINRRTIHKRKYNYSRYVHRLLKSFRDDVQISKMAVNILDSFVKDMFVSIATEAGDITKLNKQTILSVHAIQSAVHVLLPGGLAKEATKFGAETIVKYNQKKDEE